MTKETAERLRVQKSTEERTINSGASGAQETAPARTETTESDGPVTDEFSMALCAIRYCMGRMSYIVSDGIRWARQYGEVSPWLRRIVIRDIETAERINALGQDLDKRGWLAVLDELKEMEAARARR